MIDTTLIKGRILYLALQGKLSEQKTTDESASKMVSRVSKELNSVDFRANYNDSEIPFDIPDNWCWCRLSDIGRTNIGLTYHPEDIVNSGTIVVRSSNIINGKMDYNDIVQVDCSIRDNQYLDNNDIVICARNGSRALVGKCAVYEGEPRTVAFGAFMAVFRTQYFKYVYYYLQTPVFRRYFSYDDTKQINQVTQSILKNALIPLPPYEEQIRIVDRVEKILAIIDNINSLQLQYATNIEILKSKLIDAGICGKLTEQLPEDGDAEDLYNQIQDEKTKLIKEGKIKKEKPLPEITEKEIPFEIPKNWKWVRLIDFSSIINGDRGKNYPAKSTLSKRGIPFISALNLNGHDVDADENLLCLDEEQYNKLGSGKLQKDDVVICIRGSLGKHGKYPYEKGAIASSLVIARPIYTQGLEELGNYMMIWLDSTLFFKEIDKYDGGSAQPNLSAENLKKFLIPLPPIEEQKRIVEKLETLLGHL